MTDETTKTETDDSNLATLEDVGRLIDEWGKKSQPNADDKEGLSQVIDYVKRDAEAKLNSQTDETIKAAVKVIADTEGVDLEEEMIEELVYGKASKSKKFVEAFQNRGDSPEAWDKAVSDYAESLAKRSKKPDKSISDDIKAAKAATKTTEDKSDKGKHKGFSEQEIRDMPDSKFFQEFPDQSRYVGQR